MGRILGPHGVRGTLKVHSFTQDPKALFAYPQLYTKDGKPLLTFKGPVSMRGTYQDAPFFLAASDASTSREDADALRGTWLYIPRNTLPKAPDDETFYHTDLLELQVFDARDRFVGRVRRVNDFGAGLLLEIAPTRTPDGKPQETFFVRFHDNHVQTVDLAAGRLTLTPDALGTEGKVDPPEK